jgi:hypothetical protein
MVDNSVSDVLRLTLHEEFPMERTRWEEMRRDRSASSPTSSDRSEIATGRGASQCTAIFAAGLIGIVTQPAIAAVCHVPAAVLCEGCVERLSIRVTPDGACRVSFTAPASRESTRATKFIDVDVEAEPWRPAHRRVSAPHLSAAKPAAPLRPSAECFVFNGRRFCE